MATHSNASSQSTTTSLLEALVSSTTCTNDGVNLSIDTVSQTKTQSQEEVRLSSCVDCVIKRCVPRSELDYLTLYYLLVFFSVTATVENASSHASIQDDPMLSPHASSIVDDSSDSDQSPDHS